MNNKNQKFERVPITSIIPDPNQPRRYFDAAGMNELIESIRENDVIQPIVLRPTKKSGVYMVVVGERRYRAAKTIMIELKERNTIPAVIRELDDDQALELQIIENLQRKDVHPMEEATAFKSLTDKKHTNVDIAKRVGKSEFYVRQRLKLLALNKQWANAFFDGRIEIGRALTLATFDETVQQKLWEQHGKNSSGKIQMNDYQLGNYRGNLETASFDIKDETLDKKMGACINCPFNSAMANLFPGDVSNPRCTKPVCFSNKINVAFTREIERALADPEIIFVNDNYSEMKTDDPIVKKLLASGVTFLNGKHGNAFNDVSEPEKPDINDYDVDDYDSEKSRMDEFNNDVKRYEKDLAEYKKAIAGGKLKRAFSVNGSSAGKYIYLKMGTPSGTKPGATKSSAEIKIKESAGKLTASDIDAEIARLNERKQRGAELDIQKTHAAMVEIMVKRPEFNSKKPKHHPMQKIDRGIMAWLLIDSIGHRSADIAGIPKYPNGRHKYNMDYFKQLSMIPDNAMALLIRIAAKEKLFNRKNIDFGIETQDSAVRIMAEYLGVDLKTIDADQQSIADKRNGKIDARIKQLKGMKTTKPTSAKTPAKKSAAKSNAVVKTKKSPGVKKK